MTRAEQFKDQWISVYGKDNRLEAELVTKIFIRIALDILEESEDIYPGMGIIKDPKKQLYYPIPKAEHYISLFKNIFYKVDFSDARTFLMTIDDDQDSTIGLMLCIGYPEDLSGVGIQIGISPTLNGNTIGLAQLDYELWVSSKNSYDENVFFTPYLPKVILSDLNILDKQRSSCSTIMGLIARAIKSDTHEK